MVGEIFGDFLVLFDFDFDFEVLFFQKRNRIICIETRDIIFLTETIKILVLINDVENINSRNKKRESSCFFLLKQLEYLYPILQKKIRISLKKTKTIKILVFFCKIKILILINDIIRDGIIFCVNYMVIRSLIKK